MSVEGTSILSPEDVRAAAREIISGNYFYIFAKNNALLYPRVQLEQKLSQQFPRIKDISVSLSGYQTIAIQLSERGPFALWCDTPLESTASAVSNATTTPSGTLAAKCYF